MKKMTTNRKGGIMNKIKQFAMVFILTSSIFLNGTISFAEELPDNAESETLTDDFSIEDSALIDAKIISSESYVDGRKQITKTVYEQSDGTIIVDELTIGTNLLRSANGSDTAVRTRTIENFGTITLSASFSWYTKGNVSYVTCTSMTATKPNKAGIVCDKWQTKRTTEYVSFGKAYAQVSYQFHLQSAPAKYVEGTFRITCTDNGTISDS